MSKIVYTEAELEEEIRKEERMYIPVPKEHLKKWFYDVLPAINKNMTFDEMLDHLFIKQDDGLYFFNVRSVLTYKYQHHLPIP